MSIESSRLLKKLEPPVRPVAAGTLEEIEKTHIAAVLSEVGGVIEGPQGAAVRLGLNPSTLRARIRKLGVRKDA